MDGKTLSYPEWVQIIAEGLKEEQLARSASRSRYAGYILERRPPVFDPKFVSIELITTDDMGDLQSPHFVALVVAHA